MLSLKTKRVLIAVLLLSLIAAIFTGWWGSSFGFTRLISAVPDEEIICGIDQGEEEFRFFQTDKEGRLLDEIRWPAKGNDFYYTYEGPIRDGDAFYVMERQVEIVSDLIIYETVCYLDFENNRLEPVWSLPVSDLLQKNNLAFTVQNGVLSCFRTDYSGKEATATLWQADETASQAGEISFSALWEAAGAIQMTEVFDFSFDIGVGFTDFYLADCGTVAFTPPSGEVWTVAPGGEPQQVELPAGTGALVMTASNDGNLFYLVDAENRVYQLDMTQPEKAERIFTYEERGLASTGVTALSFQENGEDFCAVTWNGEALNFWQNGEGTVIRRLSVSAGTILFRAFLGFAGTWAAALIVALLVRLFLFFTKGKVPIVTKLLAAFLPILAVSLVLLSTIASNLMTTELVDAQYERLYLLTSQQTATLNSSYIEEVDPEDAFDSVYFYELRSALNLLPGMGILQQEEGHAQVVYHSNYFWLYKMVDGQLVSLICEQDYVGVPVEKRYNEEIADQFYWVAESGQILRTGFKDSMGQWSTLLVPVYNEFGEVVAVLEAGDTQQSLDHAVQQAVRQLRLLILSVMAVLALLLSIVIAISLHPLRILRQRVQDISDGNLGVQVPERGHDEVSEISRTFNIMSKNVAFRDKEIRLTSDGYSRFVPARVFGLLNKQSVIDVQLADETSVQAAVLNCSVGAFDDIARSLRSREMFRMINRVLARLVPVVDETGGMVDRFDRAGLLAIYTHQPDKALDAAITLCQTLQAVKIAEAGNQDLDFHVTLSAGPAMIGIVGAEERLEAMTISEHTSFTSFLRPLAAKYGASVLLTDSAARLIPDFESRYHARTIGFVYMRTLERTERLYDVYDGDEELTRKLKEETRELFEKGVTLFCSHEYYDARLLFIEVLKKNRRDKAARHYLYLCDTCYREENTQHDVWLETY